MRGPMAEWIADRAARFPDAPAVLAPDSPPTSAAGLSEQVDTTAAHLRALGLGPDAVVALALPTGASLATAVLATLSTSSCLPLAVDRPEAEHARDLAATGAGLLVVPTGDDSPARAAAAGLGVPVVELTPGPAAGRFTLGEPDGDPGSGARIVDTGPALLLFTSGTTSRPKLVPLPVANLLASAGAVAGTLGLGPADRGLVVMPLFHIHGLVAGLLAPLVAGGSVVCTPGFAASEIWDWIQTWMPTWYTAVPTIHQALLDVSRPLAATAAPIPSSLTFVRSSSAPLPIPVFGELERVLGVPVIEAYGMTEAAHQIASNPRPPGRRKPGTVGRPAGCEVVVLDAEGAVGAPGTVGELAIRGPSVTDGYLGAPEATAAAFRDGWFRTGDQGVIDADGYVTITGRLKEIINRGGEKVAPREVDDALLAHPDVRQAVAFAVPHPRLGEEVGAAVVLRDGATVTAAGLRVFVGRQLAAWKVPRRVVVVGEIPKGPTGKLDRSGLAASLGLDVTRADAAGVEPADDLERAVAEVWRDVLGDDEPPGVTVDFFEAGGDSLHATELLEAIDAAFGRRLPATVFFDGATVRGMADRLRGGPDDPEAASVVPVQPGGSRLPLFCVMRAGSVVTLRHFVRTLGPDQPVYGVWMPAMHGPATAAGSVEDIARTCVDLVRAVRPVGPYLLFGHSLGGHIVFEAARRLDAAGCEVGFVGVADAPHPDLVRARWARRHSTRYRLRKLCSRKGPGIVVARIGRLFGWRPPPPPVQYLPGTAAVLDWGAVGARERAYHPGPAPVPITVFACAAMMEFAGSTDLGWRALMPPGSECIEVPGDHDSMIGEPHVHVLAARLAEALDRSRDRGSPPVSPS